MRNVVDGGLREGQNEKAPGRTEFLREDLAGGSRSVVAFAGLGFGLPEPRSRRKLADALVVDLEELWG